MKNVGIIVVVFLVAGTLAQAETNQPAVPGKDEGLQLSDNIRLSGYYRARYYKDLDNQGGRDNDNEIRNDARIEANAEISPELSAVVSGDGRLDRVKSDANGVVFEEKEIALWEAYAKFKVEDLDVWLGKQVIRWGKSDELNPTDDFTPEDFSEFVNLERAERKLPVLMARANYYLDNFTFEGIYLPYFEPNRGAPIESDWYFPALRQYQAMGLTINENEPDHSSSNSVYAGKIRYRGESLDLGISYASHLNQIPGIKVVPPELIYAYGRQNSFGMEFEGTSGKLGMRGEAVYTTDDWFGTNDPLDLDKATTRDSITGVVGGDYNFENEVYFNLQYYVKHIVDYTPALTTKENEHSMIWNVSRKFFREKLELSFSGRYYLDPEGTMFSPEIKYRVDDKMSIRLRVDLFGGSKGSMMGQFDKNDQVCLIMKISI